MILLAKVALEQLPATAPHAITEKFSEEDTVFPAPTLMPFLALPLTYHTQPAVSSELHTSSTLMEMEIQFMEVSADYAP